MPFLDRKDAGRRLAARLEKYRAAAPIVLALPRGGVIVGREVARALGAPLDVLVVRKIGVPGAEEVAVGAMTASRTVLDLDTVDRLGISRSRLAEVIGREAFELSRRERIYRDERAPLDPQGRTVILVDDGLATGASARVAVESLRDREPLRIVFAAPVCSAGGSRALRELADEVVCLEVPPDFQAVGLAYRDFSPTSDMEVIACLRDAAQDRRIPA
jgi:predicted phosphoribosyltransferase